MTGGRGGKTTPTDRPNILLIVADCARSDKWLGPGRSARTPNIDRLAASGTSFPTTIVEKACTTPSFSTLLTGRYSPRHGVHLVWGYRLPDEVPMLSDRLAENGYHTYAEVTGPLLPEMGLARGFQEYTYRAPCDQLHTEWGAQFIQKLRDGYQAPWLVMLHLWELHPERQIRAGFDSPEFGADGYERSVSSLDAQLGPVLEALGENTLVIFTGDHGEKTPAEEYRPGTAVHYSRELLGIDEAQGMAPFGVANWAGPSVLQAMYGECTASMRNVRLRDLPQRPRFGAWDRLRDRLRLLWLTPLFFRHDLLALRAPLRLTRMLEKRGLLDAGRAESKVARLKRAVGQEKLLDMHMRMWINSYKHNLHEGHMLHVYDFLVRVPLIIAWPGRAPAGRVMERMVRQPDILPTVLDLLGIEPAGADQIDGRSFGALLRDEPWEAAPAFLSVSGTPLDLELRGVRTETHKFTYGPENNEMPRELYDLRADPGETRNLADQEPEQCARLRALAESFLEVAGATPTAEMALSGDDEQRVSQHLRELGYIE